MNQAGLSPDLNESLGDRGASRGFRLSRPLRAAALSILLLTAATRCGREATGLQRDDLNRPVAVPPRVQRIVTLAPNLTEIVFALGSGALIVGADEFSDEPAGARSLPKVGGMQPDIEKIAELRPDLVLASTEGNQPALGPALAAAGIPLFVVRTDRVEHLPVAMSRLGALLGSPGTAQALEKLRGELARERRQRSQRPKVLFAVWTDPLYVGGDETFVDDLIELTGAANAVTRSGWPQYSLESLLASPPDLIIYPSPAVSTQALDAMMRRVPAVKAVTIAVDEDLFTRPGPRVGEAAAALNAILDRWERSR